MPFSLRTSHEATPNAIAVALERARAQDAAALIDLTLTNPTQAALPYPREEILAALGNPALLDYAPEPLGSRTARQAIADDYAERGVEISADHIALTASTSEAYSFLLATLCEPHDEILVPAPGYPLLSHLAQIAGVHLRHYPLPHEAGAFRLDPAAIYEAIGERTRAVVVVSPNNPTGTVLDRDALDALGAMEMPLIVDEVFAPYPLESPPAISGLGDGSSEALVFSLGGLSKSAALPQLKLGWIAVGGPEEQVRAALQRLELLGDTFLSVNTPVQLAAAELLRATQPLQRSIAVRVQRNLATLRAKTQNTAITVPHVAGGWSACLRVPATRTDHDWALHLIEAYRLVVHPGFFYDFPDREAWLVISLLTPESTFDRGIDVLVNAIERS